MQAISARIDFFSARRDVRVRINSGVRDFDAQPMIGDEIVYGSETYIIVRRIWDTDGALRIEVDERLR
jgi:hypothetical protein